MPNEGKRGRKKNPGESPSIIVPLSFPLEETNKVTFGTAFGIFLISMVKCCLKSMHPWFLFGLLAMLHMPTSKTTTVAIKCAVEFGHALLPLSKSSRVKPGLHMLEKAELLDVPVEAEGERDLRSLFQVPDHTRSPQTYPWPGQA